MLEWLTPAERRGASILVVILLVGAAHDVWEARPRATPARPSVSTPEPLSETAPPAASTDPATIASGARPAGRLDLNRAEARDLDALPGIGPVLAERILEQRRRVGRFGRVDDLLGVRGVGPRLLAKLEPLVMVDADERSRPGRTPGAGAMHSAPPRAHGLADSASVPRPRSR